MFLKGPCTANILLMNNQTNIITSWIYFVFLLKVLGRRWYPFIKNVLIYLHLLILEVTVFVHECQTFFYNNSSLCTIVCEKAWWGWLPAFVWLTDQYTCISQYWPLFEREQLQWKMLNSTKPNYRANIFLWKR